MKIKFLDGSEKEFADLRGANLRDADLRGADLSCADLRGVDLRDADLRDADLRNADLRDADLTGADLTGADIDFSSWPLWCGSLKVKADRRIACQLLYHAMSVMARCGDEEVRRISLSPELLAFANEIHYRGECPQIHDDVQEVKP